MGELSIPSEQTQYRFVATTTAVPDVIIICIFSAVTVASPHEAEENLTELTLFHLGLDSGHLGIPVADTFQIWDPTKLAPLVHEKMVRTRPSTADITASKHSWRRINP